VNGKVAAAYQMLQRIPAKSGLDSPHDHSSHHHDYLLTRWSLRLIVPVSERGPLVLCSQLLLYLLVMLLVMFCFSWNSRYGNMLGTNAQTDADTYLRIASLSIALYE
jgi:hypothetical protein